jgi:radical SAM protein with 4Fe4S-binding SPASM domain
MLNALNNIGRKYGVFAAIGAPNLPCRFPEEKYRYIHFGKCSAGIDWFAIDPSGRVRVCNHSPTIIGNLLEQDFDEIWNHKLFRDFRNGKIIPDECKDCEFVERCLGGCRAVAETCYGDLRAPDPLYHSRS